MDNLPAFKVPPVSCLTEFFVNKKYQNYEIKLEYQLFVVIPHWECVKWSLWVGGSDMM